MSRQRGRSRTKSPKPEAPPNASEPVAGAEDEVLAAPGSETGAEKEPATEVEGDGELEGERVEGEGEGEGEVGEGEGEGEGEREVEGETEEAADDPEVGGEAAGDAEADEDAAPAGEDDEAGPGLEKATAPPASSHLKSIVESLLFVADKPMGAKALARFARTRTAEVEQILVELLADYRGRGIELVEVAGGFQFRSAASSAPFVRELVGKKPVRLTRAQVESLAILAYRQPMTRPELEDIRGVDCGSALKVLLEKNLIRILGRKDEAGRPLLYGTTPYFLEFFGLNTLADLPTLRELGELTDESKALFQRKMGEAIDTIGDIAIDEHHYTDEEIEALERQARGPAVQEELPMDGEEDAAAAPSDGEDDE